MSKSLNDLRDEARNTAVEHGFKDATPLEEIALMHTELSEAIEDIRRGMQLNEFEYAHKGKVDDIYESGPLREAVSGAVDRLEKTLIELSDLTITGRHDLRANEKFGQAGRDLAAIRALAETKRRLDNEMLNQAKPIGVPSEMADVIIRVLDFCGKHDIDIERAVNEKMAYNKTRPFKHGKTI
jgi:hypothetical protein